MNRYRNIAGNGGEGGGGGGATGWGPSLISYKDPFNSYEGYTEFSKTGGYSPQDIANMRSRGISPIRAAYGNAEREMQRGRSLQGGYSPNMAAAQVKMAREGGQGVADATQNVEAGLAESRNKGRLAGLGGMSGIETSRLGADLDVAKFNAQAQMASAASGSAAGAQNRQDELAALRGMTSLYGTTPAMSETFGNQLLSGVGQGGTFGLNLLGRMNEGEQLPGAWDQTVGRINDVGNLYNNVSGTVYPWLKNKMGRYGKKQKPISSNPVGYE